MMIIDIDNGKSTPKKIAQSIARIQLNCCDIQGTIDMLVDYEVITEKEREEIERQYELVSKRMQDKYAKL